MFRLQLEGIHKTDIYTYIGLWLVMPVSSDHVFLIFLLWTWSQTVLKWNRHIKSIFSLKISSFCGWKGCQGAAKVAGLDGQTT